MTTVALRSRQNAFKILSKLKEKAPFSFRLRPIILFLLRTKTFFRYTRIVFWRSYISIILYTVT